MPARLGAGAFRAGHPTLADLAGVTAAVGHLAQLDAGAGRPAPPAAAHLDHRGGSARQGLFQVLQDGLAAMGYVLTGHGKAAHRAPTAYFNVASRPPGDVARYLAGRGVNVWSGHNYAWNSPERSASATRGERCGRAWSTTTTAPTWTGCWRRSPTSPGNAPSPGPRSAASPGRCPEERRGDGAAGGRRGGGTARRGDGAAGGRRGGGTARRKGEAGLRGGNLVVGEGVAVQAGGAGLEADALVDQASRLPREGRDVRSTVLAPASSAIRSASMVRTWPTPWLPASLVHDHVLDPGAHSRGDREHHQRQCARDLPVGAGDEQCGGGRADHPLQHGPAGRGSAAGQLGRRTPKASMTSSVTSCTTSTLTVTRALYRAARPSRGGWGVRRRCGLEGKACRGHARPARSGHAQGTQPACGTSTARMTTRNAARSSRAPAAAPPYGRRSSRSSAAASGPVRAYPVQPARQEGP